MIFRFPQPGAADAAAAADAAGWWRAASVDVASSLLSLSSLCPAMQLPPPLFRHRGIRICDCNPIGLEISLIFVNLGSSRAHPCTTDKCFRILLTKPSVQSDGSVSNLSKLPVSFVSYLLCISHAYVTFSKIGKLRLILRVKSCRQNPARDCPCGGVAAASAMAQAA